MKKTKKVLIPVIVFLLTFTVSSTALAAILGYPMFWESNKATIARWKSVPDVYYYAVDGSLQGTLPTYVSHARSQWNTAGVPNYSTTSSSGAEIKIYGGTYTNLKSIEPSLTTDNTGLMTPTYSYEGEWIANGSTKTGYKFSSAKVYVVYKTGKSGSGYKKTTTHEIGHALGWLGHTSYSSDVMYAYASEITTLTSRDKRHLNQIY
ncbi:matrixin family metalloprotease [Rossellomorea vietnamensis]|uniref:Matrixin family metalloprotease n=1 Tax=Rossellomorea vietnamensis TaxID=218284 RepID=A0A5D4MBD7_9BACI|nr:matrixin family metalloprotease [Rossellomorea vietnamensis]TYR98290.1 matrixin family metalloprotease [Rossellomorea vietnamensis]